MNKDIDPKIAGVFDAPNAVYVKHMDREELAELLPDEAFEALERPDRVFALHNAAGHRVALIEGREAAFAAARANELKPYSLH
ncbi:MAG: DUF1150 family protein [Pseudomonadota bacterium]